MTRESIAYLRLRERQERAAAKCTLNLCAQRAHKELAQRYAALIVEVRADA